VAREEVAARDVDDPRGATAAAQGGSLRQWQWPEKAALAEATTQEGGRACTASVARAMMASTAGRGQRWVGMWAGGQTRTATERGRTEFITVTSIG
jgi:hypothetical protein